jgi:hypothetical protein
VLKNSFRFNPEHAGSVSANPVFRPQCQNGDVARIWVEPFSGNANGAVLGAFGAETNGTAQIEVKDRKGHVQLYARSPYDQNGAPKRRTLLP